ncbi:MAG: glutamate synthase subunit beta [Thermodesulfobacteriota bacterium]
MENRERGFLDIPRVEPGYRPLEERLGDFRAVERQFGYEQVHEQAARCMDCGTPFCHAYGCPLANLVPELNEAAFRGHWERALHLLLTTNSFPEFTGRVCPAPCEAACVAGIHGDPVTIRQIEQTVAEMGFEQGIIASSPPSTRLNAAVAVVGSGPAGLAAAELLNKNGYRVVVFESAPRPGGILRYGIPDFKLEKWVVDRRIRLMQDEGVDFEMNVTVGHDISHRYLQRRFDAVCLACGAREPRDLPVPGRELSGIHFAMDYLTQQNRRISGEPLDPADEIHARGKRVVVIGGGDTGSDCLGTALRQGAESVVQMEILPQPPKMRDPATPWPMWPRMLRRTHAHQEGGQVLWSVMTTGFAGRDGMLTGLRGVRVEWEDKEAGPPVPRAVANTEFEMDVDLVFLAMGFVGPGKGPMIESMGLELDERGNVRTSVNKATSVTGVFAAGDMSMGQSLVVRAIADGRAAAAHIMNYLRS